MHSFARSVTAFYFLIMVVLLAIVNLFCLSVQYVSGCKRSLRLNITHFADGR